MLNLLIAVRDKNTSVLNASNKITTLESYFESSKKVYEFFCETGLEEIFTNAKIKNLDDYVFGIEVGLDSNGRKNRAGKMFANMISEIFNCENICFQITFAKQKI
ncbi:DpnII family type II restriction endonuclease [Campylobacter sp. 1BO]|uniref:DpnII family type II restriction endonuclease n=1 Tax=Campylobacter sp. 1BO TaxID=3424760 RepID=UPI003D331606